MEFDRDYCRTSCQRTKLAENRYTLLTCCQNDVSEHGVLVFFKIWDIFEILRILKFGIYAALE